MQEESLGFQLTRGHVANLLKKRKKDDKEEDKETEGCALLINMT